MHPLSPFTSTNLVLLFHVVPSIHWFRRALKTIKSVYSFVSIEDIESYCYNIKTYNNCCHISFDDGDRSVYENAFPVLKDMNIPASLFVSPHVIKSTTNYWFQEIEHIKGSINDVLIKEVICDVLKCKNNQLEKYSVFSILKNMRLKCILQVIEIIKKKYFIQIPERYNITNDQLIEISNSDLVTIGAHTMNHPILSNETDEDAEKEILESIQELCRMLGNDIKYFAYPNGTYGLDYGTREQLKLKEKIRLAFSFDPGFFNKKTNPLSIPRVELSGSKKENKAWILGKLLLVPGLKRINRLMRRKSEDKERIEVKSVTQLSALNNELSLQQAAEYHVGS